MFRIMGWFNYYGMIAVAIIMIPNIVSAVVKKAHLKIGFTIRLSLHSSKSGAMAVWHL